MSKLKLWHTNVELKDYRGCSIVFLCKDGRYFHEASYFGFDYDKGEPKFQSNGYQAKPSDFVDENGFEHRRNNMQPNYKVEYWKRIPKFPKGGEIW